MPKKNGEKFVCFLPKVEKSKSEKQTIQQNSTSLILETEKRFKLKTPDELLEALKDRCFLRVRTFTSLKRITILPFTIVSNSIIISCSKKDGGLMNFVIKRSFVKFTWRKNGLLSRFINLFSFFKFR